MVTTQQQHLAELDKLRAQIRALREILEAAPPRQSIADDRYGRWLLRAQEVLGKIHG